MMLSGWLRARLILSLFGLSTAPTPWIEGWHCVYDLKTATFSVPADFAENNIEAIRLPGYDQP